MDVPSPTSFMKTSLNTDIILKKREDLKNDLKNNNVHKVYAIVTGIMVAYIQASGLAQVEAPDPLNCSYKLLPTTKAESWDTCHLHGQS